MKKNIYVKPEEYAAAFEKYDHRKYRLVLKTGMKKNNDASVVLDRPSDKHYGTGILMLYIRRRKRGEKNAYTKEIAPGWIVDFDGDDKPISIEVLSPSKHFPKAILAILPPEFVPKNKPRKGRR